MPKLYDTLTHESWWNGGKWRHKDKACLFEWLIARYGRRSVEIDRVREIIAILYPQRSPTGGIVQFNDHKDTAVVDVLRVCIVADV